MRAKHDLWDGVFHTAVFSLLVFPTKQLHPLYPLQPVLLKGFHFSFFLRRKASSQSKAYELGRGRPCQSFESRDRIADLNGKSPTAQLRNSLLPIRKQDNFDTDCSLAARSIRDVVYFCTSILAFFPRAPTCGHDVVRARISRIIYRVITRSFFF